MGQAFYDIFHEIHFLRHEYKRVVPTEQGRPLPKYTFQRRTNDFIETLSQVS